MGSSAGISALGLTDTTRIPTAISTIPAHCWLTIRSPSTSHAARTTPINFAEVIEAAKWRGTYFRSIVYATRATPKQKNPAKVFQLIRPKKIGDVSWSVPRLRRRLAATVRPTVRLAVMMIIKIFTRWNYWFRYCNLSCGMYNNIRFYFF